MNISNHILQLPPDLGGFRCSVNRYTVAGVGKAARADDSNISLILAHCTASHKEQWEPTIAKLFELSKESSAPICEAWALDTLNHGDSAILNEDLLQDEKPLTAREHGALLHYFTNSKYLEGRSRVVGVGYSASTTAWCLGLTLPDMHGQLPSLAALVLLEPVFLPPPLPPDDPRIAAGVRHVRTVLKRQDKWENVDELRTWLKRQVTYKMWDSRQIDLYVKYGFRTVKNTSGTEYITYKCKLAQEVDAYLPRDHASAGEHIAELCTLLPVHAIFSERPEMTSYKTREMICDVTKGHTMASVSIVKGVGHLAVQENPEGVAEAIFNVLQNNPIPPRQVSTSFKSSL